MATEVIEDCDCRDSDHEFVTFLTLV
jgi:hypothetical protein